MLAQALPDYGVMHTGIICRKAVPGQWEAKDDSVYALVFEQGLDIDEGTLYPLLRRLETPRPAYQRMAGGGAAEQTLLPPLCRGQADAQATGYGVGEDQCVFKRDLVTGH